jgi:hypothetical protein
VELFGADRLTVGSDYPFVVMEDPPGAVLGSPELAGALDEKKVRHTNACCLLGEK